MNKAQKTESVEPGEDRKQIANVAENEQQDAGVCEDLEQDDAEEVDVAQPKDYLGAQALSTSNLEQASSQVDKESILRAAVAQLQNDSGSVDLMKKILSQFGSEQKSEVLRHLESIIEGDSQMYNKVNEARADRDRLAKVNGDQKDQLEKLQAKNKESVRELKRLEEEKENLMDRKSDGEGSERKDSAEKQEPVKQEEVVEAEEQQQDQQEQPAIVSREDEEVVQNAVSAQEIDKRSKKYGNYFKKQYKDATQQSMTSSKEQNGQPSDLKSKNSDVKEE